MKRCFALAVVACSIAMLSLQGTAQVTKGKTRAATTKHLMGGLVQPNCAAIGGVAKQAPADDKAWQALATNAALLNESGYLLMDDGRCPDGEWAKAAETLRTSSEALLVKIAAKDVDGVNAEFKTLTTSCAGCHKAHKK